MLGIIGEEYKDKIFDDKNDKIEIPIKTSDKIKLALMKYMRFSNQYTAVCTEGVKNADVSGIKDNKLIEVEIKISKSDFKNELKHKQNKHNEYKNPDEHLKVSYKNQEIPNKFYFCVPIEMEEWALNEIDKINIKYGLLIWEDCGGVGWIRQRRSAMHLHTEKISERALKTFFKRLTSEVINLRLEKMGLEHY